MVSLILFIDIFEERNNTLTKMKTKKNKGGNETRREKKKKEKKNEVNTLSLTKSLPTVGGTMRGAACLQDLQGEKEVREIMA